MLCYAMAGRGRPHVQKRNSVDSKFGSGPVKFAIVMGIRRATPYLSRGVVARRSPQPVAIPIEQSQVIPPSAEVKNCRFPPSEIRLSCKGVWWGSLRSPDPVREERGLGEDVYKVRRSCVRVRLRQIWAFSGNSSGAATHWENANFSATVE